MRHTPRECKEIGVGHDRAEAATGTLVFVHHLAAQPARVSPPVQPYEDHLPVEVFSDREYDDPNLRDLEIDGYGDRWIRLRRTHARW
jgi:maltose alpha-D-glucosyltransferase/alpha-amylase